MIQTKNRSDLRATNPEVVLCAFPIRASESDARIRKLGGNREAGCMYFSCFGKKSTKRSRHRGGADAESIGTAIVVHTFYLDPEPPSPMYLSRPRRRLASSRIFPYLFQTNATRIQIPVSFRGPWPVGISRYHLTKYNAVPSIAPGDCTPRAFPRFAQGTTALRASQ